MQYVIQTTPCFPNSQKIIPLTESGSPRDTNNSFTEYFPDDDSAKAEITRRKGTFIRKIS